MSNLVFQESNIALDNENISKNTTSNNRINTVNSSEFARRLVESSEKMMKRNAEAYRKLAYL